MSFVVYLLFLQVIIIYAEFSPSKAPLINFRDGQIPALGLGTWLGNSTQGAITAEGSEVQQAVEWAIEAGYRHIDTASAYKVEDQVGRGVANKIADGTVSRDDMFIVTKLFNDRHVKEEVVPALRESLSKLNLTYVDLYLIHWPIGQYANKSYDYTDYVETWRGMVETKKLGLAKSIGLSNFNQQQIDRVLASNDERPSVLQVELNLNLQQPELLKYCREHGIVVTAYTPFGSLFPSKAKPDAPPPRVDDPALLDIAKKYNKTVPQITLRYLHELGVVPIPKSVTKSRIEQNIDIFDFELLQSDRQQLRTYDVNYRTIPQLKWTDHPYYPFALNKH